MPYRPLLAAGAVILVSAILATTGCTGSGLGLRGVGTPTRQSLVPTAPPPQVVTSDFTSPELTVPADDTALVGEPQPLPQMTSQQVAATPPASELAEPRKPVLRRAATAPRTVAPPAEPQATVTLQSVAPPPDASDRFTPQPDMGKSREAAIKQMREKAAAADRKAPNVFDIPKSRTQPLNEDEREELRKRMEAAADENAESVTPEEAEKRRKDTEILLKKAARHYKDALKSIEN